MLIINGVDAPIQGALEELGDQAVVLGLHLLGFLEVALLRSQGLLLSPLSPVLCLGLLLAKEQLIDVGRKREAPTSLSFRLSHRLIDLCFEFAPLLAKLLGLV